MNRGMCSFECAVNSNQYRNARCSLDGNIKIIRFETQREMHLCHDKSQVGGCRMEELEVPAPPYQISGLKLV